ncbi:tryptophan synthase beta subunit-like PLP-dependent enzyme [Cystobasidium minutum MCA 4210]|uniref:tryptophan synthase beta subunit-like PLP-dependent enzyme n=1 Tax=Cystobasidium minutum MCA 4210 TaxID=1397322 RepID=UPI0034CF28B9|eukprot:jgi/Rhomi1/61369/CE61368_299
MHDSTIAPSIAAGNPNVDPDSLHSASTAKQNASIITSSSTAPDKLSLHKITPLIRSEPLSARTGHNIYLKLDALQPSGSFKIRGVGRTVAIAHERYGPKAHIVTSSGGNAGLAAATACKMLNNLKCTIFVPVSTEESVINLLREKLGAEVVVGGDSWDGADAGARKLVDSQEEAVYIHPFIGDDLIQGHSSMPHEIYSQLEELAPGEQPDIIACTVGGGGLIQGILRGITEVKNSHSSKSATTPFKTPKVVATQDFGADSFAQSINLWLNDPSTNAEAHVTLDAITSKATSMGTKKCSPFSLQAAREYAVCGQVGGPSSSSSQTNGTNGHSTSEETAPKYLGTVIQSDPLAAASCWQFKRDHDLMVELSCGAALSVAYHSERILTPLLKDLGDESSPKNIVIVVCGGSKVDQDMLDDYERTFSDMEGKGEARVNGRDV